MRHTPILTTNIAFAAPPRAKRGHCQRQGFSTCLKNKLWLRGAGGLVRCSLECSALRLPEAKATQLEMGASPAPSLSHVTLRGHRLCCAKTVPTFGPWPRLRLGSGATTFLSGANAFPAPLAAVCAKFNRLNGPYARSSFPDTSAGFAARRGRGHRQANTELTRRHRGVAEVWFRSAAPEYGGFLGAPVERKSMPKRKSDGHHTT